MGVHVGQGAQDSTASKGGRASAAKWDAWAIGKSSFGTSRRGKRLGRVPRYYFHLINDMDVADFQGVELSNLEDARSEAVHQARGMIGEMTKTEGRIVLSHRIDIEDEEGRVLDSVVFRDIVRIEG